MVISLERGADLHMAQLMPLPLTVSCFSKIQIGFTFLALAHPVVPDKGPLNGCVCTETMYNTQITTVIKLLYTSTRLATVFHVKSVMHYWTTVGIVIGV